MRLYNSSCQIMKDSVGSGDTLSGFRYENMTGNGVRLVFNTEICQLNILQDMRVFFSDFRGKSSPIQLFKQHMNEDNCMQPLVC